MALILFDHGTRIKTPVSSIFPPRRVEASAATAAEPGIPEENSVRSSMEHLTQTYERFNELTHAHSSAAKAYKSQTSERRDQAKPPRLRASQIMSQPVYTTRRDAELSEALKLMDEQGINHLMVANYESFAVGLISRTDILRHQMLNDSLVIDAYRHQFLVATPETDVIEIATNLVTYHIGSIPVIDKDDKILGIITRTDLLRVMVNEARVERWA